jgi:hypothetical protein
MITDILDNRAKLPGQVVNVNAASRLRLQKYIDYVTITIDSLTDDQWQAAAEICINKENHDKILVIDNGYVTVDDTIIKSAGNSGWWRITSSSANSKVKIKIDGRVELSPAFSAASIFHDDYKAGVYAPKAEIDYYDGEFSTRAGKIDLYFIVTTGEDDIRRELLHQSSNDLSTPAYDVLSHYDFTSAAQSTPPNDLMSQIDEICWHQSLKTGRFYPPWDKYTAYMPSLLLKTFKLSGLCEYGSRALLALAYLNDIGETAKGLTINDSKILHSLQSLLICENN